MIEFWNDARFRLAELNPKRIYYLSIEYLLGRLLQNCLLNLGVEENYGTALKQLGYNLEDIFEQVIIFLFITSERSLMRVLEMVV